MPSMIQQAQSTFEWRHQAPGHFIAKSLNAHFNAALLRKASDDTLQSLKETEGYGGNPKIAAFEGYIREIGVALELAVKAVICKRIEAGKQGDNGLPHHHQLVDLWEAAALPRLSRIERFQLFRLSVQVEWAGRYPTPRNEAAYNRALDRMLELELSAHPPPQSNGSPKIRKARGTDEVVLERLYDTAIGQAIAP